MTVDIPFDDKTFLRKRYQDTDHGALPTCTAFITVPMRNKNDGELHTYTCEYEVYHGLTNAEFASNLNDDGVVVVDDSGKGHVRVTFAKLDREEGFELELGHLYDDPMLGREWLRRKFAPGEIGMFEGEKVVDGNIALRMMPDRRYVEATVDFDFVMEPQHVNAVYARWLHSTAAALCEVQQQKHSDRRAEVVYERRQDSVYRGLAARHRRRLRGYT